jgi:tetratricopeptide (TPR) repeat protein
MSSAHLSAAWALMNDGQYRDAATAFRRLAAQNRADEDGEQAAYGLGYALAFLGEFGDARAIFVRLRRPAAVQGDLGAEHRALHQVGMVERMAEPWSAAHACFIEERQLIERLRSPDLEIAVNADEMGIVELR